MNNDAIQIKIKERLNKLDSQDYDNIECWQMVEAFNKAQLQWSRNQLHGKNMLGAGDEGSKFLIDDLQKILAKEKLLTQKRDKYFEVDIPENYLWWKRLEVIASSECCDESRNMVVYLAEEANIDLLLRHEHKKPNFNWGETFCTLVDNKVRIYTNNEFEVGRVFMHYYRLPLYIEIKGCSNPYNSGVISTKEVECEFKDDIVEILIDEAVKIISSDIEYYGRTQMTSQEVQKNT